jgi:saccharopine dehydrogenase-like NADP-dependent oxidoreductase
MKVVVLGGAGDVGSRAAEDLAEAPEIELVTIADRNLEAAEALARRLSGASAKVVARGVDADDEPALIDVIRGHDVAASALGPFHRFEVRLVRASIEAGVDYASVCDEYQAAEAAIDGYDQRAREAGRTLITGLGVSPGLTNLAIRALHEDLGTLERVRVSVYQPLTAGGGEAVLRHMLFIMDGEIAVWRDGERQMVRACSEQIDADFPRFGRIRTWNMGHAEPVTVPRFLPGIRQCEFFMGYGRGARLFVEPARRGFLHRPRRQNVAARLVGAAERALSRLSDRSAPDPGAIRIDAWGRRNGKPVHELVCGVGLMRDGTGLSLAIGARLLGSGQVTRRGGVMAPEACLDPREFMGQLEQKGLRGYRDLAMTRPFLATRIDAKSP